jgi:serine/threonine-protein kinase
LDYDHALEQFAVARKSQPNSSRLLSGVGWVQRRQGKFEKAVVTLKEASELDPRSAELALNIGETFMLLRKYSEAERYFDRAISLTPDWPEPYSTKAWLYVLWEGSIEKASAILEQASQNIGSVEDQFIVRMSVLLNVFDGNYQEALTRLSSGTLETLESQFYFIPKAQLYAQINGLMGNQQLVHTYYESARSILESKIQERPEDERLHSALGIAYAGLGRKEDALREGKLGVELLPVTKEAWRGLYRVEDLAKIYVMVGEFDAAIDQLEFLLSIPSELSIPLLRLDPAWDPLRDHRRFKRLLEKGE